MSETLARLAQLRSALCNKGLSKEAEILDCILKEAHWEMIPSSADNAAKGYSHFTPGRSDATPEFFRRNYDYGESIYNGDPTRHGNVKDWLDGHRKQGPDWERSQIRQAHLPKRGNSIVRI